MNCGLNVILVVVVLQTTWESVSPRRDGSQRVEQGCQATSPSSAYLPERREGTFPDLSSDIRFLRPELVSSPEVPFVGGILDVVANVVEHPVSRGAVAGIEHLEEEHHGTDGLLPSSAPPAPLPIGEGPRAHSSCLPIGLVSISLLHHTRKNPLKVGMGHKGCG